ncbi:unannotated protein [freshwater metagenome]|uniref:Unannotated protein n=1 Tax=freshwater metagenome TaxID=449393 RepID=A0A6J5ZMM6_9ZZZZ
MVKYRVLHNEVKALIGREAVEVPLLKPPHWKLLPRASQHAFGYVDAKKVKLAACEEVFEVPRAATKVDHPWRSAERVKRGENFPLEEAANPLEHIIRMPFKAIVVVTSDCIVVRLVDLCYMVAIVHVFGAHGGECTVI